MAMGSPEYRRHAHWCAIGILLAAGVLTAAAAVAPAATLASATPVRVSAPTSAGTVAPIAAGEKVVTTGSILLSGMF